MPKSVPRRKIITFESSKYFSAISFELAYSESGFVEDSSDNTPSCAP